MLKKIKIFIVVRVVLIVVIFLGYMHFTFAQNEADFNVWTYLFHLYYDNGQLLADRDFEFKYDLVAEEFAPETTATSNSYKGEVVSGKDKILAIFNFDLKHGNPSFTKGKISVKGPWFANASQVKFYNSQGQLLLTLDIGGGSFCNDDDICNSDVGENYANCPNDCKAPPVIGDQPSFLDRLPRVVFWGALGGIIVIVFLVVRAIIKRKRERAAMTPLMPHILF